MAVKMYLEREKTSWLEKFLYGLGGIGCNLCWTFMSLFITVYYTNSAGIAAAVVGTFMLVSRVFDGISDIIFSAIMQKTHFKMGKVRPWFLIAAPLLGLSILLCFNVPVGLSAGAKGIYAFITYAFTAAVSYTIVNLAFASFLPLISYDDADRGITSTVGNIMIYAGVMAMNIATPILLAIGGGESEQGAWRMISIIYAVLCMIFVSSMAIIKEKQPPMEEGGAAEAELTNAGVADTVDAKEKASDGQLGFKEALQYVLKSKYTWILLSFYLLFTFYSGTAGIGYYSFMYVVQDTSLYGIASTGGTLAAVLGLALCPLFFQKLGKQRTIIFGMSIFVIASLLTYINPRDIVLITAIGIVKGFVSAPVSVGQFVFVADLTDYILKKHGVQISSVVAMTSSVGIKVGTGFGSAAVGWGLQIIGFNAMEAVQSAAVQNGIIFIGAVLPAVCAAVMVGLMFFWDIDKQIAKMS